MSPDEPCVSCKHSWYDHGGRFTEAERIRIMKVRSLGCWVVGCGCVLFQYNLPQPNYEVWED